MEEMISKLAEAALEARKMAYAPYSGFLVGAALLGSSGKIYSGCNIENASFSPTNCAERTAFFKAISEGEQSFEAIAIAGGPKEEDRPSGYCAPCGVCRQVMMEFCDPEQFRIYLIKNQRDYRSYKLKELFPEGFIL